MLRWLPLVSIVALVPAPLLAGPPVKRPTCQIVKAPVRDAKRPETCRRATAIPPVIDPTPLFLASAPEQAPQYAALY